MRCSQVAMNDWTKIDVGTYDWSVKYTNDAYDRCDQVHIDASYY